MTRSMVRQVAVVDDDDDLRDALCQALELDGLTPRPFSNAEAAIAAIDADFPGIVLSDLRMPGMDGLALFATLSERHPDLPVIVLTGHADIVTAVDLMQRGAYDFLAKPFTSEALLPSVARALEKRALVLENRRLKSQSGTSGDLGLIGESRAIETIRDMIAQLSATDMAVMLVGEPGTGKSLIASILHRRSTRANKPLVTVDCSALPAQRADSHLFGHVSGAFPGAQFPRTGELMRAHGGTVFLDRVEGLAPDLQARLARVLEDRAVLPLGGNQPVQFDARRVSASTCEPRDPAFNPSLRHWLAEFVIAIPPLRERREDVAPLFRAFASEASAKAGRDPPVITAEIWDRLQVSDWPGNVRELRSYATAIGSGLDYAAVQARPDHEFDQIGLKQSVEQFEGQLIRKAIERCGGDVRETISLLRLPRKTFYDKLTRYDIEIDDYRKRQT